MNTQGEAPDSSPGMHEAARREKLRKIVELGFDPWGGRLDDVLAIGEIRTREQEIATEPAASPDEQPVQRGPKVRAAGRIVLQRKKGKLIFVDIRDSTGQVQIFIGRAQVGENDWALAECFDLGDIIGVDGELKHTKTGELTIFAERLHFLTKSLEPPPEKHHGLTDPELRQRMRYLDLTYTEGVLPRFVKRAKIVQSIRGTLAAQGFIEVEGPTLHTVAGGAAARPFKTHHNALDLPLSMRIALELHLKRLLVGGMERVFELGRVYRNEGISPRHNPEFTMLEVYQAYGDYRSMMDLTEQLVVDALTAIGQGRQVTWDGQTLDFATPFPRHTYDELFARHTGVAADDVAGIRKLADEIGFDTAGVHPDVVKREVFEEHV
jgi:lysyl-tRNA synthetase class 2